MHPFDNRSIWDKVVGEWTKADWETKECWKKQGPVHRFPRGHHWLRRIGARLVENIKADRKIFG